MRINIFGGPGSGKSTFAAKVFSQMKVYGMNVELINEYVKFWTYIDRQPSSFDQVYIFGKQLHKEDKALQKFDHIITDSPLLMQMVYCPKFLQDYLLGIEAEFERVYNSLNIFIDRGNKQFEQAGRFHNEKESKKLDEQIKELLDGLHAPYIVVDQDSGIEELEQYIDCK